MSAARSRRELERPPELAHRRPAMGRLRARRREARRRRRLARLDIAIGVGVALALFIISPGLAVTGIVALLTLLACGISVVLEHRHAQGKRLFRPGPARGRTAPRRAPGRAGAHRPGGQRSSRAAR
jgi:hypothetical protein